MPILVRDIKMFAFSHRQFADQQRRDTQPRALVGMRPTQQRTRQQRRQRDAQGRASLVARLLFGIPHQP